jgi:hypothetical protein
MVFITLVNSEPPLTAAREPFEPRHPLAGGNVEAL